MVDMLRERILISLRCLMGMGNDVFGVCVMVLEGYVVCVLIDSW